jgi:segregation and condensation protein A
MGEWQVEGDKFKGPIETLLELIESRKMHISDVSLAAVADSYIAYVQSLEELPMDKTAQFVYVATILLLIKSKALLPNLEVTQEEQGNVDDLKRRLAIYQILREAGRLLTSDFGKTQMYFANETKNMHVVFNPTPLVASDKLLTFIKQVISNLPKEEKLQEHKIEKKISLEEMILTLQKRVQSAIKTTFKEFAGVHKGDKVNIIVSFLALLELVKMGTLEARQETHFGDIEMETQTISTPQYT